MLRLGSAWYDVKAQITAVTEKGLDPRNFILCTDDCHSGTLVNDGHMNRVVRHAIDCGLDPLVALQMATINTATHFGLERELGSIAPGRRADCILTSDLRDAADRDGDRARRGRRRGRGLRGADAGLPLAGGRAAHGEARPAAGGGRLRHPRRPRAPTGCGRG